MNSAETVPKSQKNARLPAAPFYLSQEKEAGPLVEQERSKWNVGFIRLKKRHRLSLLMLNALVLLLSLSLQAKPRIVALTDPSQKGVQIYIEGWAAQRLWPDTPTSYLKWEAQKLKSELSLAQELLQKGEEAYRKVEANDAQIGLELGAELLANHLDEGAELQDAASAHALLGALYAQEGFTTEAVAAFGDALSLMPSLQPLELFSEEERTLFLATAENLAFTQVGVIEVKEGPYEVWVDGRFVGVSPLEQSLAPGLHQITLRRSHKMRQTQAIHLKAKQRVEIQVQKKRKMKMTAISELSSLKLHPADEKLRNILLKKKITFEKEIWVFRVFRLEEEMLVQGAKWGPDVPYVHGQVSVSDDQILGEGLEDLLAQWDSLPGELLVLAPLNAAESSKGGRGNTGDVQKTIADEKKIQPVAENESEEAFSPLFLGSLAASLAVGAVVLATGGTLLWWSGQQRSAPEPDVATRATILGF